MPNQITSNILMIRPVAFRLNEQTAVNNYYQKAIEGLSADQIQTNALLEFDAFVEKLKAIGVNVNIVDDTPDPSTPDSIFPNNWVSFHETGEVGLYPMYAKNRRLERRQDVLDNLSKNGFEVNEIVDFTSFEKKSIFLEGTGSMILDRQHKLVYAALSERTNEEALTQFCKRFNYQPVVFHSYQTIDSKRLPIYHTNVMMCVAKEFAIICADSIDDTKERQDTIGALEKTGKKIIEISEQQVDRFAGNMLQVMGANSKEYLIMSTAAYTSLNEDQISQLESFCTIVHSSLDTIEALGGGSARCMMAEVFLPLNG